MNNDKKENPKIPEKSCKQTYEKPRIVSEKLNSYGAVCNGTTVGGRKASSTGPAFCNANKLNS